MFTQHPTVVSATLLTVGLALGVMGLLAPHEAMLRGGYLACLASLPFVIVSMLRKLHQVSAEQLASAKSAGYYLALRHVAGGLLDRPTPTGPGEHAPSNVIQLRQFPPEQEAQ